MASLAFRNPRLRPRARAHAQVLVGVDQVAVPVSGGDVHAMNPSILTTSFLLALGATLVATQLDRVLPAARSAHALRRWAEHAPSGAAPRDPDEVLLAAYPRMQESFGTTRWFLLRLAGAFALALAVLVTPEAVLGHLPDGARLALRALAVTLAVLLQHGLSRRLLKPAFRRALAELRAEQAGLAHR